MGRLGSRLARSLPDDVFSGAFLFTLPLFLNPALFGELLLFRFACVGVEIGRDVHVFESTCGDLTERRSCDRTAVIVASLRLVDADQEDKTRL